MRPKFRSRNRRHRQERPSLRPKKKKVVPRKINPLRKRALTAEAK
jgi:hypothetical protein